MIAESTNKYGYGSFLKFISYFYKTDFLLNIYFVSKSKISSNVYGDCEISVQLAICRQDH